MKIPYSCPNLDFRDVAKAFLLSKFKAKQKIEKYFSDLTGKKYVIITNSCRTALFLAYKSLNKTGQVITSPLTCKVALDPILESNNSIIFADISKGDLNIDTDDLENRVTNKTIALQVIHLGGISCNMDKILATSKKYNLSVIEDCAQALGSRYKDSLTGTFGDISCFSLIKNAYGIGGGIFATNSHEIFNRALYLNDQFRKVPELTLLYRVVRNVIDTKRKFLIGHLLFQLLIAFKRGRSNYTSVTQQLCKISPIELKIASIQIDKYNFLHDKRKMVGKIYYKLLTQNGLQYNNQFEINNSSFTKYFIFNPLLYSLKNIPLLKKRGIEIMHLEQKYGNPYQEKLVESMNLKSYNEVHDCLISLPITEYLTNQQVEKIVRIFKEIIQTY